MLDRDRKGGRGTGIKQIGNAYWGEPSVLELEIIICCFPQEACVKGVWNSTELLSPLPHQELWHPQCRQHQGWPRESYLAHQNINVSDPNPKSLKQWCWMTGKPGVNKYIQHYSIFCWRVAMLEFSVPPPWSYLEEKSREKSIAVCFQKWKEKPEQQTRKDAVVKNIEISENK